MSTIAYDGTRVAFDTMVTRDGIVVDSVVMKVIGLIDSPCAWCAGGAGDYDAVEAFKRWVRDDKMKEKNYPSICAKSAEEHGSIYFIVDALGSLYEYGPTGHPGDFSVEAPHAIGSGAQLAKGAMLAGANAVDAVRIASSVDVFTGGYIYEVKEGRPPIRVEQAVFNTDAYRKNQPRQIV